MDYADFLRRKTQHAPDSGFEPIWMPDCLFDFQAYLTSWAIRRGRAAILSDCGTGKSLMQLVWAENVARHTDQPVLILTPLAVSHQTVKEADKFGMEAERSQDGTYSKRIVVTNYERLANFNSEDFAGIVLDEAGILKSFQGATRKQITRFMNKTPYRLLCTATAAPNDYVELGNSSEALGELSYTEMLRRFFRQLDDKGQKGEKKKQEEAERIVEADPNYFRKLSYRIAQTIGQWRLKHHAVHEFWRWVASWARACRMPSDLGFDDGGFILPPLTEEDHIITPAEPPPGMMFNIPARGLSEERDERKRTIHERCEYIKHLVDHNKPALVWCHYNPEGDLLEEMIGDGLQVAGKTPDDRKIELYNEFIDGNLRVLICKPKIGAWGLNMQHCSHVASFATHSYEQYYQCIRRCYRFGQENPVKVDMVATEGEVRVLGNLRRKSEQADRMFDSIVREMQDALQINRENIYTKAMEVPSWL